MNNRKNRLLDAGYVLRTNSIELSFLLNSIYYFIERVFILKHQNYYRLVAFHRGSVLTDERYKTLKGAKIAFTKFFQGKAYKKDIKPQWSHFYSPESQWIDKMI